MVFVAWGVFGPVTLPNVYSLSSFHPLPLSRALHPYVKDPSTLLFIPRPSLFVFYKRLLTPCSRYGKVQEKVNAMSHDITALELIYRNCQTEQEMEVALAYHGISKEQFTNIAMVNNWPRNPVAIKNLCTVVDEFNPLQPADKDFIEESNKASVRRINNVFEYAVTKFQLEMANLNVVPLLESIDLLAKIRERLTKLEFPLYGLNVADPQVPVNPIHVFLTAEEGPPPGQESDS